MGLAYEHEMAVVLLRRHLVVHVYQGRFMANAEIRNATQRVNPTTTPEKIAPLVRCQTKAPSRYCLYPAGTWIWYSGPTREIIAVNSEQPDKRAETAE